MHDPRTTREARAAARTFGTLPDSGSMSLDSMGGHHLLDQPGWITARLSLAPASGFPGWSWIEQVAQPNGAWIDNTDGDALIGDNGSVSGQPQQPAFPLTPGAGAVNDIVLLFPGYLWGDAEVDGSGKTHGRETVFITGGGGGDADPVILFAGIVDPFNAGNPFVIDGNTGVYYWLAAVAGYDQTDGIFTFGPPWIWVTTPYQATNLLGNQGAPLPNVGNEYDAELSLDEDGSPTLVTLEVDLMDSGGTAQPGTGTTHVQTLTLPLFMLTQYPAGVEIVCIPDGAALFYPQLLFGP